MGISPFSLFFPFSQRPGVGISPLSLFPPPLRGQGSHPFRVPAVGMSHPCRHGAHPQPGFWDGFAAFRVIPSPEQWETLLNFRVCCSLPTHQRCGWLELPISSLAQAFNWGGCQRQGGIKGRQVLQEHPPLAGREPRGPLFPIIVFGSKARGFSVASGFKSSSASLLLMPPKICLSSAGTWDPWAGAGATNSPIDTSQVPKYPFA